jgi:hypothetical protein
MTGCTSIQNSSYSGTYVNVNDHNDYIELHSDSTCIDHSDGPAIYYGKYEVDGMKIRLFSSDGSSTMEYQYVDNSIIVDNGITPRRTYKKQS